MSKIKFLWILLSILFAQKAYPQKSDFSQYAMALSEITTFAEYPGFKDKVSSENSEKEMNWETGDDGYIYTQDIEDIRLFGYKVLFESDNHLTIGVYYDSDGSSISTYLIDMTTTDDTLILNQIIGGGDRCHNAVVFDMVEIEGNVMSFSTLITPNKLMTWFSQPDKDMTFDDCMVCCLGFANFNYDLIK